MKRFLSSIIAGFVGLAPVSARAGTYAFSFTFSNMADGYPGTITGVLGGLTNDATSSATSLEILSNTAGFGLGGYAGLQGIPSFNTWTLSGGQIVSYDFLVFGVQNAPPLNTCCTLLLASANTGFGDTAFAGLADVPRGISGSGSDIVFTPLAVPEPSTWAMMLLGFAGLAFAGYRRTRKAVSIEV